MATTVSIPILLLGIDKCRGDLGLTFLQEIVDSGPALFKKRDISLDIQGLSDTLGYINLSSGNKQNILLSIIESKKKGKGLERNNVWSNEKDQFARWIAESYTPGLIIVDMVKDFDMDKLCCLLHPIKDLELCLISPLSRPPLFKERASLALGPRFKSFAKMPSAKRLLNILLDSLEWSQECSHRIIPDSVWLKWRHTVSDNPTRSFNSYPPFLMSGNLSSAALEVTDLERKNIINNILTDPQNSLLFIQSGSSIYASALSHLIGLGSPIPSIIQISTGIKFDGKLGFGPYFANLGAIRVLIDAADQAFTNEAGQPLAVFLECIFNFVSNSSRSYDIVELFCQNGGIELLFKKNQRGSILHHSNGEVREWTRLILDRVWEHGLVLRKCDMSCCTTMEKYQGSFHGCSQCQSVVYCSKECQTKDWLDSHSIECRWHRCSLPI